MKLSFIVTMKHHLGNTMINYKEIPEFKKDFKVLHKRFKTLNEDFEKMKKYVLEVFIFKIYLQLQ